MAMKRTKLAGDIHHERALPARCGLRKYEIAERNSLRPLRNMNGQRCQAAVMLKSTRACWRR